jgi:hypothetical protein
MRPVAAIVPVLLLAAVPLLAATGCGSKDWRVQQLYGGPTSMEVLTFPQVVEAFRIDPRLPAPDKAAPRLGDFNILAGPVPVPAADADELKKVILDPETYDWYRAKGCDFRPGVGLRFMKDASRVELALCFECDELMIFRHGRRIGMEDFDAARPRLVAVVKRLFPDDPQIQALK